MSNKKSVKHQSQLDQEVLTNEHDISEQGQEQLSSSQHPDPDRSSDSTTEEKGSDSDSETHAHSDLFFRLRNRSLRYKLTFLGILMLISFIIGFALVALALKGTDLTNPSPSNSPFESSSKDYTTRVVEEVKDEKTGEVKSVIVSSSGATNTSKEDKPTTSTKPNTKNSDSKESDTVSDTQEDTRYLDLEVLSLNSLISPLGDSTKALDIIEFTSLFSKQNKDLVSSIAATDSTFMQEGFMEPQWLYDNIESLNSLQRSSLEFWNLKVEDEKVSALYDDLLASLFELGGTVEAYAQALQHKDVKKFSEASARYEDLKLSVRSKLQDLLYALNLPIE